MERPQEFSKTKIHQERWPLVLDKFLDASFEKRESTRENALSSLIQEFNNNENIQIQDFVEEKFATILYHCLNSIKKGLSKEVSLAARLLGLVALTTIPGGHFAQEILQESISPISEALKSNRADTSTKASLIDCMAVIAFLGGPEKLEETEEAIKTLCYLANLGKTSPSPPSTIASFVAAVSLLLTTNEKSPINMEIWREPICFLSTVVDKDKETSLWLGAAEALALSIEIPSLKFISCPNGGSFLRDHIKGKVVRKIRILGQKNMYMLDDIFEFLDYDEIPQESRREYTNKTWGEFLQMKFLKHFFGDLKGRSSFRGDN